jgi:predicted RNase H-like HicB family nuclease
MGAMIAVVVEHDKDGYYAWSPELPGCQSQGDTLDEAMANIREAVELYCSVDTLSPSRKPVLMNTTVVRN